VSVGRPWSELEKPTPDTQWDGTILDGIPERASCYFVHSFTAEPTQPRYRLADCDYDGRRVSAAEAHAWGSHPEHGQVQSRGRHAYYEEYTLFACADPRVSRFERG